MKIKFVSILFILSACSNTHREYTIEEFMDITAFGGSSFSPDENSILIRSNESGVYNAYEIDLNTNDSNQLTFSDTNSISQYHIFPMTKDFFLEVIKVAMKYGIFIYTMMGPQKILPLVSNQDLYF